MKRRGGEKAAEETPGAFSPRTPDQRDSVPLETPLALTGAGDGKVSADQMGGGVLEEALVRCSASVRSIVEFSLQSGDLTPGSSLSRMREGTLSHQARQRSMPDARAEVSVRGAVRSERALLTVLGRIDLLYERDGVPVIEEIKLAPSGPPPEEALPVHRAQAVCYAYLLELETAIVRVLYVRRDGGEAASFEEKLSRGALAALFEAFTAPYLAMLDDRLRWRALRDASVRALPFPFGAYRVGQREMAVHVFAAVKQKKRLFAQAPTGTGKTAAALFPALKALGEGMTGQIYYLTARTTAQENAATALQRMRGQGLRLRVLTLTAREKVCLWDGERQEGPSMDGGRQEDPPPGPPPKGLNPFGNPAWGGVSSGIGEENPSDTNAVAENEKIADATNMAPSTPPEGRNMGCQRDEIPLVRGLEAESLQRPSSPPRCDLLACPYAIGFFDRLSGALGDMRLSDDWSREAVRAVAEAHTVCPFEFALTLCEEADAVVCDYNYAFDPAVRIKRIFQFTTNVTLLVDEAHNLPDRARSMLSASLGSEALREARRAAGKALGRKSQLYKALTKLIGWVEAREEGAARGLPEDLPQLLTVCTDEALEAVSRAPLGDLPRALLMASAAADRFDDTYALLTEKNGKHTTATLMCLDPAPHLRDVTKKLRGSVFFSATLTPLSAFRDAIGGAEGDALLSLPSPFPEENLLVLRLPVSTRYQARERTAARVADAILALASAKPGCYIVCFPSYAYLRRVQAEIEARGAEGVTLHVQRGGMGEAERAAYLAAFTPRSDGALVGMIVLGGVFSEGVDLPGDRLSGAVIVGVGLPQIGPERELLRAYYQGALSDGFAHAYRYPGMNKVLQAVGRVIRSEADRGVALLIDDRFLSGDWASLMPPWWGEAAVVRGAQEIRQRAEAFWRGGSSC